MKTRKEILKGALSPENFEKAVANAKRERAEDFLDRTPSRSFEGRPSFILSCAFLWYESPEGHEHWQVVEEELISRGL